MFLRMYLDAVLTELDPPYRGAQWVVGGRKGPAVRMEGSL